MADGAAPATAEDLTVYASSHPAPTMWLPTQALLICHIVPVPRTFCRATCPINAVRLHG